MCINGIPTHNNLAPERPVKHLAKLPKWLRYALSSFVYCAFDYMLLSYDLRDSEWNETL